MPSPPRSLHEAVQRIARALADDDGSGWWGEEECGAGHVDAARRLAEAAGVPVLLERLEEVERENERLREALAPFAEGVRSFAPGEGVVLLKVPLRPGELEQARSALAQGAAAPLPGDTEEGER